MLGSSLFEDEISQDAIEHKTYCEFVLELFRKSYSKVLVLLGDNCSMNQGFSKMIGIPLVECCSHRFNLAVKDYLEPFKPTIDKVNNLMKRLKYLIIAGQIRKHTDLYFRPHNVTRWGLTSLTLSRYQNFNKFLPDLDFDGLAELSPSYRENKEIEKYVTTWKTLKVSQKRYKEILLLLLKFAVFLI